MIEKHILMIALDFLPCLSVGVQRTLQFSQYLPEYSWHPSVLTVPAFVHDKTDNNAVIPDHIKGHVHRAFALNATKQLSFQGKYFEFTARPDRYASWYWHGVMLGRKLIRDKQFDVIWSTYPCSTAHRIANHLARATAIPWVADYRDPYAGHHYTRPKVNAKALKIDGDAVTNSSRLVFTTEQAAQLYRRVYPAIDPNKMTVIENGFNAEAFDGLNIAKLAAPRKPYTLMHSGSIYGEGGRNPRSLFEAVARLKGQGLVSRDSLRVVFRGVDEIEPFASVTKQLNVDDIIEFLPSVNYQQSLDEMMSSDALLLLQGKMFNNQIPGKAYEYLRACKPILAMVNAPGATAYLLASVDHAVITELEDVDSVTQGLERLLTTKVHDDFDYSRYSRKHRTEQLAELLDELYETRKQGKVV